MSAWLWSYGPNQTKPKCFGQIIWNPYWIQSQNKVSAIENTVIRSQFDNCTLFLIVIKCKKTLIFFAIPERPSFLRTLFPICVWKAFPSHSVLWVCPGFSLLLAASAGCFESRLRSWTLTSRAPLPRISDRKKKKKIPCWMCGSAEPHNILCVTKS